MCNTGKNHLQCTTHIYRKCEFGWIKKSSYTQPMWILHTGPSCSPQNVDRAGMDRWKHFLCLYWRASPLLLAMALKGLSTCMMSVLQNESLRLLISLVWMVCSSSTCTLDGQILRYCIGRLAFQIRMMRPGVQCVNPTLLYKPSNLCVPGMISGSSASCFWK